MENRNLKENYYRYLRYFLAKDDTTATPYDKYMALAYVVRSEMVDNWIKTVGKYHESNVRRVYFLSMEYIFGKNLRQNMINLGIEQEISTAVKSFGLTIEDLYGQEDDFEIGNSGKARTAVCYLESMATLGIPALAYGLRYDYAQFQQDIKNGNQFERPYDWLHRGHPWEIIRPEYSCTVNFAGDCQPIDASTSFGAFKWQSAEQVHAIPYDVPVPGYRNNVVNTLRLWSARASEEFLPDYLNHGDYVRACEEKSQLGRITKVLFPEEDVRRATELRMKQQYFFISAALQDIIRRYKVKNKDMSDFDKKVIIQLSGSRCALAIPELMRILIDNEKVPWDKAWAITRNVFAYTSYAVLRENLETWPVYKVAQMLPRHMQIIFEINQVHLEEIRKNYTTDPEMVRELSLIEEGEVKRIRLANLAVLGAFAVNGVSTEQTEIVKKKLFPQYARYLPQKFCNLSTGIAHRRWMLCANSQLSELINSTIGDKWTTKPEELLKLEAFSKDSTFLDAFCLLKKNAKKKLIDQMKLKDKTFSYESVLYDIQCGKIHPYKRQVLHIFNILHRYIKIKRGEKPKTKRLHVFAGKSSPSDFLAKQIVHLINVTSDLVNNDPDMQDHMKVVFIPNFGMSWAESLVSSADISEQISTASMEAAATFNMKFAFNGALTVGSRSGTNIEIAGKIGIENMFIFGMSGSALLEMGQSKPSDIINADPRLCEIFRLLDETLTELPDGAAIFPLISTLRDLDRFFILTDFSDYLRIQELVDSEYSDSHKWAQKCILNIARIGWFSSDRTVREYADTIWKVPSL
jgi:starch phosphorylase